MTWIDFDIDMRTHASPIIRLFSGGLFSGGLFSGGLFSGGT